MKKKRKHSRKHIEKLKDFGLHDSDSAPIDKELSFLQVKRNDKRITMHEMDLMFLKDVQDKVADFVEVLFYKKQKEMEESIQKANDFIEEYFSEAEKQKKGGQHGKNRSKEK